MTDQDRKYKQRGYMEEDARPPAGTPPPGPGGKRLPVITSYKELIRCDACGAELSPHFEISFQSRCPKCRADLHNCRNCFNFDPSARWECSRPIRERIWDKQAANRCPQFESRKTKARETTYSTAPRPEDARRALENLFKKK